MKNKLILIAALIVAGSAQAQEIPQECNLWLQKCEFLDVERCVHIKVSPEVADELNRLCLPPYIERLRKALAKSRNADAVVGITNILLLDQ